MKNLFIKTHKPSFNQNQNDDHQESLSFIFLQFYEYNCLNRHAGNVYFRKQ